MNCNGTNASLLETPVVRVMLPIIRRRLPARIQRLRAEMTHSDRNCYLLFEGVRRSQITPFQRFTGMCTAPALSALALRYERSDYMSELTINRIFERMMLAATGCVLIALVALVDENVRGHVTGLLNGGAMAELTLVANYAQEAAHTVSQTIGFEGKIDSPMWMFAGAAGVLFVFMVTL
jgi:hypothetical protein